MKGINTHTNKRWRIAQYVNQILMKYIPKCLAIM